MKTIGWYMGQRVQVLGSVPDEVAQAWLDGVADEQSGDVDALAGHLYRVDNHLVLTDSDGNVHAMRTNDNDQAEAALNQHRQILAMGLLDGAS